MLRKFKCLIANGLDALVKFVYFRPGVFQLGILQAQNTFSTNILDEKIS